MIDTSDHAANVQSFLNSEGLEYCKKRIKKLLVMSPAAFETFKLNNNIAKYCKVRQLDQRVRGFSYNFIF